MDEKKILLMKALDGELSEAERQRWETLLTSDKEIAAEYAAMAGTAAQLSGWRDRMMHERGLRNVEKKGTPWAMLGVAILGVSTLAAWGFGMVEVFMDPAVPAWVRWTTGGIALGLTIAFAVVVWQRLATLKTDSYGDIER
jgi:anti-sigma factor RsiW